MSEARRPTYAWEVCEWIDSWIGHATTDQELFPFGIPRLRYDVAVGVDSAGGAYCSGAVSQGGAIAAACSKDDARRIITLALGLQTELSAPRPTAPRHEQLNIFGGAEAVRYRTTQPRYRPFSVGQLRAAAARWLELDDVEKVFRAARAIVWFEHENPCIWRYRRDELIVGLGRMYAEAGWLPGQNAIAWSVSEAVYRKSDAEFTDDDGKTYRIFRDPFTHETTRGVLKMTVYSNLLAADVERRSHGERNFMVYADRRSAAAA